MAGEGLSCVVAFSTTSDAMAVEAASGEGRVPGHMIPLPAKVSAGCGLAWCVPAEEGLALAAALEREGLAYMSMTEVEL